jgi:hypothetical protein
MRWAQLFPSPQSAEAEADGLLDLIFDCANLRHSETRRRFAGGGILVLVLPIKQDADARGYKVRHLGILYLRRAVLTLISQVTVCSRSISYREQVRTSSSAG